MARRRGTIRIGTSGYQYDHWRGRFYPAELPRKDWFGYYAERFDTLEINNTFYQLPRARTFDDWRERAPAGFLYALKLNRYITHIKRLKAPRGALRKFLARAERLRCRLGPILVQLPPNWGVHEERLDAFLRAAPRRHRWCVEFRDRQWLCDSVYEILRKRGAALCLHDMLDDHPQVLTAGWTYLRFHGDRYRGSYSPQALTAVARRIRDYAADGVDVYVCFNNDEKGHAVRNAADLKRYLQLE